MSKTKKQKKDNSSLGFLFLSNTRPTKIPTAAKGVSAPATVIQDKPKIAWRRPIKLMGLLAVIVFSAYTYAMYSGFVFNDGYLIDSFRQSMESNTIFSTIIAKAIESPLSGQAMRASIAMDIGTAQASPAWYHFTNVWLHLCAVIGLFVLVLRLCTKAADNGKLKSDPYYTAFAGAAIFACHPLGAGAVAYISARMAPLVSMDYFWALNFLAWGAYTTSTPMTVICQLLGIVFTGLGVLTDVKALSIPVMAIVVIALLRDKGEQYMDWIGERVYELALLFLAALCLPITLIALKAMPFGNGMGAITPATQSIYIANELKVLATFYIRGFFVPLGLSIDPPMCGFEAPPSATVTDAIAYSDPFTILGGVIVAVSIGALIYFRRNPIIFFSLALFLVGLLPDFFIRQPEVVAAQRFYLSLAGLCTLAGYLCAQGLTVNFKRTAIAFGCLILLFISGSIYASSGWKDNYSLWKEAVQVNPKSARAHSMLALVYANQNKWDESVKEQDETFKTLKKGTQAIGIIAKALTKEHEGDINSAEKYFEMALSWAPRYNVAPELVNDCRLSLIDHYMKDKKLLEAKGHVVSALADDKDNPNLNLYLGQILLSESNPEEAFRTLEQGMMHSPKDARFYEPIAEAALQIKKGEKLCQLAKRAAQEAVKTFNTPSSKLLFARACVQNGDLSEAYDETNQLIKEGGNLAQPYYVMFAIQQQLGNTASSLRWRKAALALDPGLEFRSKFAYLIPPTKKFNLPLIDPPTK